MSDRIEPPFDSLAAGSPWPWRPIHICTDDLPDDDEGPPPWTNSPHPKMTRGRRAGE